MHLHILKYLKVRVFVRAINLLLVNLDTKHYIIEQEIKGGFILSYKRNWYGGILLNENELKENKIYHNIEVEYYKITNEENKLLEEKNKTYGIEVIMREHINGEIIIENEKIVELTKNERIVEKVLQILKNNEVTPTTVKDVIEDLFKDKNNYINS